MIQIKLLTIIFTLFIIFTKQTLTIVSLAKQVYIPGGQYSLINVTHNFDGTTNFFDIEVTLNLAQIVPNQQTNSVFDYFSVDSSEYLKFMQCYNSTKFHLQKLYQEFQPCQQICNYAGLNTFTSQYRNIGLNITLSQDLSSRKIYIIDNTFYPCENGAYQPGLFLSQDISTIISSDDIFYTILMIVCVCLLQVVIILLAYIIIMCSKMNKRKMKLSKLKQQSQVNKLLAESILLEKQQSKQKLL